MSGLRLRASLGPRPDRGAAVQLVVPVARGARPTRCCHQDETALAERYWEQPPEVVDRQLGDELGATAAAFDVVSGTQWDRTGRRSNGSLFTVSTLATYLLHDVEHHLHDVGA